MANLYWNKVLAGLAVAVSAVSGKFQKHLILRFVSTLDYSFICPIHL